MVAKRLVLMNRALLFFAYVFCLILLLLNQLKPTNMKKTLLSITFFYLFIIAQAQPTLLSSEMVPYGTVMTEKYINNLTVIDTTIQGAGAVWNFSGLANSTDPDMILNIVNPSTTPYSANFPSSNYGYKEVRGATTNYRYFSLVSTKMERVGSYVSNVNIYSDPQIEYVFPLTLGTTNTDTWASSNSSTGGTYDLVCIGSGTLTTPGGMFNALLVRVHVVESFIDINAYYWYSSDNGAPLLTYIPGDGFFISPVGMWMNSIAIGIEENDFVSDIRYNNPAENNFKLSYRAKNNANYTYTVINSIGQKVNAGNVETTAGNYETLDIDLSNYPSGIYFFTIRSNESDQATKTIKFIKE